MLPCRQVALFTRRVSVCRRPCPYRDARNVQKIIDGNVVSGLHRHPARLERQVYGQGRSARRG
jgi:hypothetical protein